MEVCDMSAEFWQLLITIVLVITIVVFLFKRVVKVAIAIGAILLLFNVGFIMSGTDVRNTFDLDNLIGIEKSEDVEKYLNDFDRKREEYGVVDPEKVYDGMVGAVEQGTVIVIDGIGKIDIIAFSEFVANKIVNSESDPSSVDRDALRSEIKDQLNGISEEDLDRIMDEIEARMQE